MLEQPHLATTIIPQSKWPRSHDLPVSNIWSNNNETFTMSACFILYIHWHPHGLLFGEAGFLYYKQVYLIFFNELKKNRHFLPVTLVKANKYNYIYANQHNESAKGKLCNSIVGYGLLMHCFRHCPWDPRNRIQALGFHVVGIHVILNRVTAFPVALNA